MAIRPTDLQLAIVQTAQNPPAQQRAEEAPRQAQLAAQSAFVSKTDQRNESVAETTDAKGNKIDVKDRGADPRDAQGRRRQRAPGQPFEEVVEDAAGLGDPPHLIDFTA